MKLLYILIFIPTLVLAQAEEDICKNIYKNIVTAIGNNSPYPPQFVFDKKNNGRIAYIRNNKIHLEKATYAALAILGEKQNDGIAFILAHELAHHYLNHSWLRQVGYAYSSSDIGDLLKEEGTSIEQRKIQESQADFYASFYAHIAGYNSLPIASEVLDIVYSTYKLDTNLVNYPTLHERKMIVQERLDEHENLTIIFDAAKIALLAKMYPEAISCYEYILNNKFTSREIFNNLGVAQLNTAIDILGTESFKYYVPIKLDGKMRDSEIDYKDLTTEERKNTALEILESSLYNFNVSLTLDKGYTIAKTNRISSLILLSYLDKSYELEMLNSINTDEIKEEEKNNFLGTYYALIDDKRKSKKHFSKSSSQNNALAILNLNKLNDNYSKKEERDKFIMIDEVDLEDIVFRDSYYKFRKIPGVKLKIINAENSVIYSFGDDKIVQITNNNKFNSVPIIPEDISIEETILLYGNPNTIISDFDQIYYVYDNFIFNFYNSTNRLKQLISII